MSQEGDGVGGEGGGCTCYWIQTGLSQLGEVEIDCVEETVETRPLTQGRGEEDGVYEDGVVVTDCVHLGKGGEEEEI